MLRILVFILALTVSFHSWSDQSIQTPQVKTNQKSESSIQNKQNSDKGKRPLVSEQVTIANSSDPQENSQNGDKEGTEFWPPFYGYRFKITDSLLVLFTGLLTIFTALLWHSTKKLWTETKKTVDLARQEFIASHRPRIIVRGFQITDRDMPIGKQIGIVFTAQNIGDTEGKIVEVRSATVILLATEKMPTDFSFPFSETFNFTLASGTKELFPANGASVSINNESTAVYTGHCALYCLGTLVYKDIGGTRRETGFCRRYFPREDIWEVIENEYEYAY